MARKATETTGRYPVTSKGLCQGEEGWHRPSVSMTASARGSTSVILLLLLPKSMTVRGQRPWAATSRTAASIFSGLGM